MRVLHLFSNHKWTGPAEPAVNLCATLRSLGIDVDFACPGFGLGNSESVLERARAGGLAPITGFALPKVRGLTMNRGDVAKLRAFLRTNRYDLIHCHMTNDHSIGVGGAQGLVPVVRTSYQGAGMRRLRWRTAYCLKRTAFLIEPSRMALDFDRKRYRFPAVRMEVVPAAIDMDRFDPARVGTNAREGLGIPKDAFVLGIVARMQGHRLFEVLLEAVRVVSADRPELHLVVVGRGTHQEAVAKEPARELGISDRVHFPGYVSGDGYVELLNAFDMKVFMTPGTDGTCRAVREAMAMGKAAIVNEVGMLPELIEHGETGLVFDGTVEGLASSIQRALKDPGEARRMGEQARTHAQAEFPLETQAARVAEIYERVLAEAKG